MVPKEGLEPTLPCEKEILSLSRLPFRHFGSRNKIISSTCYYVISLDWVSGMPELPTLATEMG